MPRATSRALQSPSLAGTEFETRRCARCDAGARAPPSPRRARLGCISAAWVRACRINHFFRVQSANPASPVLFGGDVPRVTNAVFAQTSQREHGGDLEDHVRVAAEQQVRSLRIEAQAG